MFSDANIKEADLAAKSKNDAHIAMQKMAKNMIHKMYDNNELHGAIGIGGVQGTLLSASAIKDLPIGVPKVLFSTVANGKQTFGPLVGISDMSIMHSVIDIAGINRLMKKLMNNAAASICGMVNAHEQELTSKKTIGITMGGVTTPCVMEIKDQLENKGYEVLIFHCNGIGALTMERLAEAGEIAGVMDITPHDVTDYLYSGLMPAHSERYETLAKNNIPTLIAPGCADILLFNGVCNVPDSHKERKLFKHNDIHTHVRTDNSEMRGVGEFIAEKFANTNMKVSVMVPQKGYSQKNYMDGPLYDPQADTGFVDGLRGNENIMINEFDCHINDKEFSSMCVQEMLKLMEG